MDTVIIVIHLMVVVALIAVVLLQRSEGGALGIGGGNAFHLSARAGERADQGDRHSGGRLLPHVYRADGPFAADGLSRRGARQRPGGACRARGRVVHDHSGRDAGTRAGRSSTDSTSRPARRRPRQRAIRRPFPRPPIRARRPRRRRRPTRKDDTTMIPSPARSTTRRARHRIVHDQTVAEFCAGESSELEIG